MEKKALNRPKMFVLITMHGNHTLSSEKKWRMEKDFAHQRIPNITSSFYKKPHLI